MSPLKRIPVLFLLVAVAFLTTALQSATAQYFRFGKNKVHYQDQEWFYVQSEHFKIYFYEGGQYLANYTAKEAEKAYNQISRLFQYRISKRIPLITYLSHGDFSVTNAVDLPTYSEGIGGVTELFKNRIAIPFTGDYQEYRKVVHHEIVHAVINDIYFGGSIQAVIQNNIRTRLPAWFNEGLAEYAAQGWDTESDMYVREAILGNHLPPINYLGGFYAYRGGQSVWDYIAEQYGAEKVGEILQRLRLNRSIEGSFKRSTGLSVDELSEKWQQSLREIYFPEVAARENINDIARAIITREQGFYNTSPTLSPLGDRVAFITTTSGLFDIYLASSSDGTIIRRLVEGQTSAAFESLHILTPGITWNPAGTHIAVSVKRGPRDAIAIIDVETTDVERIDVPDIEQILSLSWSPDGSQLALEGVYHAQSDIYLLNIETASVVNLTRDIFGDHEPSWSPDGTRIVFHSDRGEHVKLGEASVENFELSEYKVLGKDLYVLSLGSDTVLRLTDNPDWDQRSADFGPDNDRIVYISDENGVLNLYEMDLDLQRSRPLTDVMIGITQVSLSADGRRAALVSLKDGTPSIYVLRNPTARILENDILRPNVWAQRVGRNDTQTAPAVTVASARMREKNPYIRDALDGIRYARGRERIRQSAFDLDRLTALVSAARRVRGEDDRVGSPPSSADEQPVGRNTGDAIISPFDTTYSTDRVDFRNYRFSSAFDRSARASSSLSLSIAPPQTERILLDANGNYVPRKYKLDFSPDIVYGAAGYDALYGVQGVTQMMFSDMLGDHRIVVATNLLIDLRNSDYILSYTYLPKRVDWTFSTFHMSRLLADFEERVPTYYRYRQYGGGVEASWPLDKFQRFDISLSLIGVSQADVTDVTRPSRTHVLLSPRLTYTRDGTTPGFVYPTNGSRLAISLSGSAFSFTRDPIQFLSILGDARTYASFGKGNYVIALRASAGTSLGPNKQLYYTSGVLNWINREFDQLNGFPISDVTDFIFATPILPLRGYSINSSNGSNFGLINAEFRFPLVAALLPGPIPLIPLYNVSGQAFVDAGTVWGGRGSDRRFNFYRENESGKRVLDDLLIGTGFGFRTIFLGYPIRLDFAWPFDGRTFGDGQTYVSIGFDF